MKQEHFLTYRDKVIRLEEIVTRKRIPQLKAIGKLLTELKHITIASGASEASKIFILGAASALKGIKKSESQLGLFSDDFENLTELMATELASNSFSKVDAGVKRVLKWYIELILITVIGVLHLAAKPPSRLNDEVNEIERTEVFENIFKNELILRLFFSTEYPRDVFKEMAESLGAKDRGCQLMINAFEGAALIAATLSFANGDVELNGKYLENVFPRLKGCIEKMIVYLPESTFNGEGEVKTGDFKAFLRETLMALEQQDPISLIHVYSDVIENYGLAEKNLNQDIKAIKKMFTHYEEAFKALSMQRVNTVDMVG